MRFLSFLFCEDMCTGLIVAYPTIQFACLTALLALVVQN